MTATYLMDVRDWCDEFQDAVGLGNRVGPLVPLRAQRKLARDFRGLLHGASCSSKLEDPFRAMVNELLNLTFKCTVDELKPHMRECIQDTISESFTNIASRAHLRHPRQPPNDNNNLEPAPEIPTEPEVPARGQRSKRPISEVHRGSSGEWETSSGRKRQNVQQNPQRSAPNLGRPTDPALEHPVDRPQAAGNDTSVSPILQKPIDQYESEGEEGMLHMDNLDQSEGERGGDGPEVENSDRADVEMDDSEPQVDANMEVPTRQNSPDMDYLDRMSYLNINSAGSGRTPESLELALEGLRTVLRNQEAEFKSNEQKRLVSGVLDGLYLMAIIATGGGKSMAFEVPAAVRGQLTIAIAPFRTIDAQIFRIAKQRGIPVARWKLNTTRDLSKTRLAIIAVETITTEEFTS